METVVSFKLAKLADEKGFKLDTFWAYNKDTKQCKNKWVPSNKFTLDEIAAPTITQLLEWVRQKFQLNIYCRVVGNLWAIYIESIPSGDDITPTSLIRTNFASYEAAMEAGLEMVFNSLLKNEKFEKIPKEEKDIFIDDFLERLVNEEKELNKKIINLDRELQSNDFMQRVGEYQFQLLTLQYHTMVTYHQILTMRIKNLT
jgi:hypothetical protein